MPPENNIPRLSFNNLTGKAQPLNQPGLAPKTSFAQQEQNNKFNIGNTLGSIAGTLGGVLSGPVGWVGLGLQAISESIKAGQSQFDLNGMQKSMDSFAHDFYQSANSVDNSSDVINLASRVDEDPFSDEINNSRYEWDGNILSLPGAIFGIAATERDKQKARDAVARLQTQKNVALNDAAISAGTKDYRRRMADYFNSAAFGGPLNTHGADFSDGIIRIDEGGTHEHNPLGGVPAGIDSMGYPNLVEEGERIWNDYVFSDRLRMPKSLVNKYKLGGKKNKSVSFAEGVDKISEKLGTELRPNDPITQHTRDAILNEFEDVQEEKRLQQEKKELLKVLASMTPEEFTAMIQSAIPQTPAEETPMNEQVPPQEVSEEGADVPVGLEQGSGIPGMALGGRIFKSGGPASKSVIALLRGLNPSPSSTMELLRRSNAKVGNATIPLITNVSSTCTSAPKSSVARVPVLPDWNDDFGVQDDAILGISPDIEIPDFNIDLKEDNLSVPKLSSGKTNQKSKALPTWMRYAPVVGNGLSVLSDILSNPDYSGAENLLSDSRRLSSPVSIPVTTISNRLRRNPFDERLAVNQANQNYAAGIRSTLDTAGGNRAFRQYATSQLARDNQGARAELARNAYLANRQDALQTADFNRQTDLYNMEAINRRNSDEAKLNSDRQMKGFEAKMNAQNYLDSLRRRDEQLASEDMTALLTSLNNIGNENEQRNWLKSLAEEGILNFNLGDNGILNFIPHNNGGKIKTKKRRF